MFSKLVISSCAIDYNFHRYKLDHITRDFSCICIAGKVKYAFIYFTAHFSSFKVGILYLAEISLQYIKEDILSVLYGKEKKLCSKSL